MVTIIVAEMFDSGTDLPPSIQGCDIVKKEMDPINKEIYSLKVTHLVIYWSKTFNPYLTTVNLSHELPADLCLSIRPDFHRDCDLVSLVTSGHKQP